MPSADGKVGFGIVGSGMIAGTHLGALAMSRHGAAIAVADYPRDRGGRSARGEALAKERSVRYAPDYRRLLDDSAIDVILVALPNALHAEVALAALSAGKHVVIEKPLCLSLADA